MATPPHHAPAIYGEVWRADPGETSVLIGRIGVDVRIGEVFPPGLQPGGGRRTGEGRTSWLEREEMGGGGACRAE
ncbi:hypothetical protein WMY93_030886 [Mugilogobius chulae]|uniref:Uncharacterized protein n=1 Tax=Mugilogobius chulae TaxID=88201 RepID=A0AAW0MEV2_9GOBI